MHTIYLTHSHFSELFVGPVVQWDLRYTSKVLATNADTIPVRIKLEYHAFTTKDQEIRVFRDDALNNADSLKIRHLCISFVWRDDVRHVLSLKRLVYTNSVNMILTKFNTGETLMSWYAISGVTSTALTKHSRASECLPWLARAIPFSLFSSRDFKRLDSVPRFAGRGPPSKTRYGTIL